MSSAATENTSSVADSAAATPSTSSTGQSDPARTCSRFPGYCRCPDCRDWWARLGVSSGFDNKPEGAPDPWLT